MNTWLLKITVFAMLISLFTGEINVKPQFVDPKKSYEELWKEVNEFDNKGLPKSALEVVETIYAKALNEQNGEQVIKSCIYRYSYIGILEEDGQVKSIKQLENDIQKMPGNSKYFGYMLLAEMYNSYLQMNYYLISQRTRLSDFTPDDIATWDESHFKDKIIKNYMLALNDALKSELVEKYPELIQYNEGGKQNCPSVYDLFSNMAFSVMSKPASYWYYYDAADGSETLTSLQYCEPLESFLKMEKTPSDSISYDYYAFMVLKNWLSYRGKQVSETEALVYADLIRLNFYKAKVKNADIDSTWLNTLLKMHEKYAKNKVIADIDLYIATEYVNKGSKYSFIDTTSYRFAPYNKMAYDMLKQVIKLYPDTSISGPCMNLLNSIERKDISLTTQYVINPDANIQSQIAYKNVDNINFTILQIDYEDYRKIERKYYDTNEKIISLLAKSKVVRTEKINFGTENDFNKHARDYFIKPLPKGHYLLVFHLGDDIKTEKQLLTYQNLFVSDLVYTSRNTQDGNFEFYVFNRNSGKPVKDVVVSFYTEKYNYVSSSYVIEKEKQFLTDENGFVSFKPTDHEYRSYMVSIKKDQDFVALNDYFYSYNYNYTKEADDVVNFFTDRGIYRPGQTIHFKGIAVNTDGIKTKLLTGFSTTVELYDPNYQLVSSLNLKTNLFGSFSGSFEIPLGNITGQYRISCSGGTKYVSVEEYKRPNFEVSFKPIEEEYRIGDKIKVTGFAKTYASSNVTDAKVKYRVQRNVSWRGYPYYYSYIPAKEVAFGELVADENGEFVIEFESKPDYEIPGQTNMCFQYTVSAVVTDITGETQNSATSVFATNKSLILESDMPQSVNKQQLDTLRVYSRNINGKDIKTEVMVKITSIEDPKILLQPTLFGKTDRKAYSKEEWTSLNPGIAYANETDYTTWKMGKTVYSFNLNTANTNKIFIANEIKKLLPGYYCLTLSSHDKFGNEVVENTYFSVYDPNSNKMPYTATHYFCMEKSYVLPGETASFYVGSSFENVQVLYEIECKNEIVSKKWINISNEVKRVDIPVLEEHRGDFNVHLFFVKNGRQYTSTFTYYVPWTNKMLEVKLETFRDKIEPGSAEEWKIKVVDNDGNPVSAEVLAGMYDASLDAFAGNYWSMNFNPYYYSYRYWGQGCYTLASSRYMISFPYSYVNITADYVTFSWHGLINSYGDYYGYASGMGGADYDSLDGYSRDKSERNVMANKRSEGLAEEAPAPPVSAATGAKDMEFSMQDVTTLAQQDESGETRAGKNGQAEVHLRSNFNETAFFYPHLVTDKDGVVSLAFKAPESLTRWNLMALAHTVDLKVGVMTQEIVTRKELMLMPNAPRFVRENDTLYFSAKVSNITESQIKGVSEIHFFDAFTMKDITDKLILDGTYTRNFDVKAGGNAEVSWKISIPEGLAGIVYRITAKSDNHTDGEEKYLPVLPNRMLVTETMPLPIRGNQTKKFSFDRLKNSGNSSTLSHHKLTLEFTSNPAWYAVQALPYLAEYPYECAEQTFSRYYANSMASYIANSDPKIKRVFEIWRNTPGDQALKSNLEKNQELKALLLEETPWVMQAKDETERKRRIGLLFDMNQMQQQMNAALKKLKKMQVYNGAWPWFEGMPEDRYITQHILGGIGHLHQLGVVNIDENSDLYSMTQNATGYIDNQIVRDYKELKKYYTPKEMELMHIGYYQIHYLYVRSFYSERFPISDNTKEAFNYYLNQAEKYWLSNNQYMQGMLALALNRFDKKTKANEIVASLKEYSLSSDEMGMYWKANSSYYWYEAPIETQSLMIEVFHEVTNDSLAVEEMKIWLLKQKQTQDWKTTKATADAIYALLLTGIDLLADDQLVEITLGSEKVNPAEMKDLNIEAGTGYFSKFWNGTEIKPQMGDITVRKAGKGIGWGAVYWQYFEQLDKITCFEETPLKINKKLFVEQRKDGNVVMTPVSDKAVLHNGDKVIVRIEIRTDRDMEYVHLKDMRAACFEPESVFSGYRYSGGLGYYQSIRDASMNFFISYLYKGTYVFEYSLKVTQKGEFSNGITTMQCMYAPEFSTHSQGIRVKVE